MFTGVDLKLRWKSLFNFFSIKQFGSFWFLFSIVSVAVAVVMGVAGWSVVCITAFRGRACFHFRHADSVGGRVAVNVDLIAVGSKDQARHFAGFADRDNGVGRLLVVSAGLVGGWFVKRREGFCAAVVDDGAIREVRRSKL